MGDVSKDLLGLLIQLLPGFVTAWVLYSFTSYVKPSQFERVIQALIFSYLIAVLVAVEESALLYASRWLLLGHWSDKSELIASACTAILVGVAGSYFSNHDTVYALARVASRDVV